MDFKRTLREYLLKPIVYTGLVAAVLLGGCEKSTSEKVAENANYNFESFGNIKKDINQVRVGNYMYAQAIATGDFDGDGDLDIAIVYEDGMISIYENKIPQKSKN